MIIDAFDEVQNLRILLEEKGGYEEKLIVTKTIEILPKLSYNNSFKNNPTQKRNFQKDIYHFLKRSRNIGEDIEEVVLLENQNINIPFEVYLENGVIIEDVIARMFFRLFELIYRPIRYYSHDELIAEGKSTAQIYSGPRLSKGFIKNESLKERITTLNADGIKKLLAGVKGVRNCKVIGIECNDSKPEKEVKVHDGHFFHILDDDALTANSESRLSRMFQNMTVYLNQKKVVIFDKNKIARSVQELWAKKYRQYPMGSQQYDEDSTRLKGTYRNTGDYHSIQHQFPMIYGIGKNGVSSYETLERQGKANQLKAYLMFFEQLLANDLAQIGNLGNLFSIKYDAHDSRSYFGQRLDSVPRVETIYAERYEDLPSSKMLETDDTFYDRKHRMFDHLLARFGEELNDIPWNVARSLNLLPSKEAFNKEYLEAKSNFLQNIQSLSYSRMVGESFYPPKNLTLYDKIFTEKKEALTSGLAAILKAKTTVSHFNERITLKEDIKEGGHTKRTISNEVAQNEEDYEEVILHREIQIEEPFTITNQGMTRMFGVLPLHYILKNGLLLHNYKVSKTTGINSQKYKVIFNKGNDEWISLFSTAEKRNVRRRIRGIINYLVEENERHEGFYLIDHIVLRDFLYVDDVSYGFHFVDTQGETLLHSYQPEMRSPSPEGRLDRLQAFYKAGLKLENYCFENCNVTIAGDSGKFKGKNLLANTGECHVKETYSCCCEQSPNSGCDVNCQQKITANFFEKVKGLIALFDDPNRLNGRLRLSEVEKIRLGGIYKQKRGVLGQRRLIFDRKIPTKDEIVSEDFFNLKVSVMLPDWPAKFQDERFKDYFETVLRERAPAHIHCEIYWLSEVQMLQFENNYHAWKSIKSDNNKAEVFENGSFSATEALKKTAYDLYNNIIQLEVQTANDPVYPT